MNVNASQLVEAMTAAEAAQSAMKKDHAINALMLTSCSRMALNLLNVSENAQLATL